MPKIVSFTFIPKKEIINSVCVTQKIQLLDISRFRKNTGNRKFQLKNYTCFLPRYVVHTPLQYTSE